MHLTDEQAMLLALEQARCAALAGEVPVGAVVLHKGQLIAAAHNAPVSQNNPCAHAEIVALCEAATTLGNYRLEECELFVTLEPCVMCAGALLQSRLRRVVFAAAEPKTGAAGSVLNLFDNVLLNHHTRVEGGLLADQSTLLLRDFFHRRRLSAKTWPLRDDALRTPVERFLHVAPSPYAEHYIHDLPSLKGLRLHYWFETPDHSDRSSLCIHGPNEWGLAWQTIVAELLKQGENVVLPDLIGFGRSDKPKKEAAHKIDWHAQVLVELLEHLQLDTVTLWVSPASWVLGQAIFGHASGVVKHLKVIEAAPMASLACNAPYPDAGHRAAQRVFAGHLATGCQMSATIDAR